MDKNNKLAKHTEPLPKDYESFGRDELHKRLQLFIVDLLDNNFEKLCNMIYRHDVSEGKFNEALLGNTIVEQASAIADLVLERELEKVATRKKYRRMKEENMLNKPSDK